MSTDTCISTDEWVSKVSGIHVQTGECAAGADSIGKQTYVGRYFILRRHTAGVPYFISRYLIGYVRLFSGLYELVSTHFKLKCGYAYTAISSTSRNCRDCLMHAVLEAHIREYGVIRVAVRSVVQNV